MSHPITTLMRNMAQKLTDEIGDGLQHTETASRSLADNIVSKINSRTIEPSINRIPIYIIIAHSSLEVNYSMPDFPLPGGENVCIDGEHACFFTSNKILHKNINKIDYKLATNFFKDKPLF